ncbi:MAG: hypothetical protein JST67_01785 [Bacteroidetes bacterium]|nr:hypothetical protein [Bacteroidota bacterium]
MCLLAGLVFAVFSCSGNKTDTEEINKKRIFPDYHIALDSIIKTEQGVVSGIELGQNKNNIAANETKKAIEKDASHLTFEQAIDSITKYSITYSFENDTISEIEVIITSKNADEGVQILNDLKNYYRTKYTAPLMDKGYFVFNCFDSKKRNFVITLTDNSGATNSVIDMYVYREK